MELNFGKTVRPTKCAVARNNNLGMLAAFMLMANRSAQRNKGAFKNFSSGGGGFRGSGGFGGGSFGGGGAGGSW